MAKTPKELYEEYLARQATPEVDAELFGSGDNYVTALSEDEQSSPDSAYTEQLLNLINNPLDQERPSFQQQAPQVISTPLEDQPQDNVMTPDRQSLDAEDAEPSMSELKTRPTEESDETSAPIDTPIDQEEPSEKTDEVNDLKSLYEQYINTLRDGESKSEEDKQKLSDAQKSRRIATLISALGDVGGGIAQAVARRYGGDIVKPDYSDIRQLGELNLKELEEQQKEESKQRKQELEKLEKQLALDRQRKQDAFQEEIKRGYLKVQQDQLERSKSRDRLDNIIKEQKIDQYKALTNPNSDFADSTRKLIVETYKEEIPNIDEIVEGRSAMELDQLTKNYLQKSGRNQEYLELRRIQEKRLRDQNAVKMRKDLINDPRMKNLLEKEQVFAEIPALIEAAESGNEVALGSIGTRMAKAMGEVGVLTETDVVRYLGNKSYARKMINWFDQGMKGKLPKATAQELHQVADLMQHIVDTKILPVYNEYANALVENYDYDPDEALRRLGAPGYTKQYLSTDSKKSSSISEKDPKIEKYAEDFNLDYKQAEQILKARGYGQQ